ncbi:MAG TPA: hypothetical protein DCS42_14830 [Nitrospiraceae bacterium]|nr:hypothetical protein [Nitrospiraceae bacterium]
MKLLRKIAVLGIFSFLLLEIMGCGGSGASPVLVSLTIAPADSSITLGATQQFTATGTYSDGSTQDLTSSVTWTSSDTTVAPIDSAGLATSAGAGSTTIKATSGNISGSTSLTVTPALLNSHDADGFLWGTEGSVLIDDFENITGTMAFIRDIINSTLKTKYVKIRLQDSFFTSADGGVTYSPTACMPNPLQCISAFNMDETAKLFKTNGWSMVPMFTYDMSAATVTTAGIDRIVNFVDWFVGRYKVDGGIQYIELEDYPASWWKGTDAQLLEMTNNIYDRIKAKCPDVWVGTPGFEYWIDTSGDATMNKAITTIEYFLDKSNGARFDFWAFHGYALADVLSQGFAFYPPTRTPVTNKYAGIPGILEIRKALDANGWQDRPIIDTEHFGVLQATLTDPNDRLEEAYMVQHSLLERTLHTPAGNAALYGVLALKIFPSGAIPGASGSLYPDGSLSKHLKAVGLLRDKLRDYHYSSHVSGAFDDETQAWVEKFQSGSKELYIFFKPFHYAQGQTILLDGETLNYTLNLDKVPSAVVLTDVNGSTSAITPAQTLTLGAENGPKFLEVTYP